MERTLMDVGEPHFTRTKRVDGTARLERVLDAKTRTIGVDKAALETQIAHKNDRDNADAERNMLYDQLSLELDQKLMHLEAERRSANKDIMEDLKLNWATIQAKENRLEWDLNNPDGLKLDLPARISDQDPRLGPSSMQMFSGEDLTAGERKKLQLAQQCSWLEQQVAEKEARKKADDALEQSYANLTAAQVEHMKRVADAQLAARKENTMHTMHVNSAIIAQKEGLKDKEKEELEQANQTDQFNTYNSQLLNECPSTALHATNPNRRRMDHYKGMVPEEKQQVIDCWPTQRAEREAKKEAEKQEEIEFAQYQKAIRKELGRQMTEIEAFRAEQRKGVQQTLLKQRTEKAEREKFNNASLVPTQKFFEQFGTSHR